MTAHEARSDTTDDATDDAGSAPGSHSAADGLPTGLAEPARRALAEAGYRRLGDLDGVPEATLRLLPGVGPRALRLLKLALAARGLALGE